MFTDRIAALFGIAKYDNYHSLPCVQGDLEGYGHRRIGLRRLLSDQLGRHSFEVTCSPLECSTSSLGNSVNAVINDLNAKGKDVEETLLLFYFSGHGFAIQDESPEDQFLIAASDTEPDPRRGLRFSLLLKRIEKLRATVVCYIDCCYGGNAIAGVEHYIKSKKNFAIFASCSPNEESYFTSDQRQSWFTSFLIDVLLGQEPSALRQREVTCHSLQSCIECRQFGGQLQRPTCWVGGAEILLARPHGPISVPARLSADEVTAAFREYVEGRLREYADDPERTSDEFFIRNECQRFVFSGSPVTRQTDRPFTSDTLSYLGEWFSAKERPLLLVMGDTGTGKSMTLKRFWHDQAKEWLAGRGERIPFFFDLRLFAGIRLSEMSVDDRGDTSDIDSQLNVWNRFRAVFCDAIQNKEGLPIFWKDFEALCREGRLLIIFDGLDEMDVEGLSTSPTAHFKLLLQLFHPNGKMALSCRTHYLRSEIELATVLNAAVTEPVVIHQIILSKFSDVQVGSYLRAHLPSDLVARWHKVRQTDSHRLLDLCRLPFLLSELLPNFEEVIEHERIRPSKLFHRYLETWLKRDDWRFRRFLRDFQDAVERDRVRLGDLAAPQPPRADLEHWRHRVITGFIEIVATHLWATNTTDIPAQNIRTIIRSQLPSAPDIFVSFFDYAIRTCSFFTRPRDNIYEFLDRSVLEYFAIRKFRDDILNAKYSWDHSDDRATGPVPRIPIELGKRALTPQMADMLADSLRGDQRAALRRLPELIGTSAARVEASPETLYYLPGNCLSVYARLKGGSIPRSSSHIDLKDKWLNGALLEKCDLSGVDLSGALIEEADLRGAILHSASLDGTQIYNCRMQGIELNDVRINGKQKNAIVVASDDFNPVTARAPPAFINVFQLSNTKGRQFNRPRMDIGPMVAIPGGVFWMGTTSPNAERFERPPIPIRVAPFYLDKHPVTNAQFAAFIAVNPEWSREAVIDRFGIPYYLCYWRDNRPPEGAEHHPVVYVSWYAAAEYAAWMGKRLPAEAEWEFALRDGNENERWDYPNGPTPDLGISEALRAQIGKHFKSPVGQPTLDVVNVVDKWRISKTYGLVDMIGNINEWVQDWFSEDFEERANLFADLQKSEADCIEAFTGPAAGDVKVIRGSSFLFEPDRAWSPFATYYRRPLPPKNTNQDCGFRCALSAPEYERARN